MNHVIRETAATAQNGWLIGIVTALFMALFIGTVIWLWSSRRARTTCDEAAQLPLDPGQEGD